MLKAYLIVSGIVSLLELILFSYDKVASGSGRFRIPVYVMMIPVGIGGALGAFVSMLLYRHKTQKMFFKIPVYFCLVIQVALLFIILFKGV